MSKSKYEIFKETELPSNYEIGKLVLVERNGKDNTYMEFVQCYVCNDRYWRHRNRWWEINVAVNKGVTICHSCAAIKRTPETLKEELSKKGIKILSPNPLPQRIPVRFTIISQCSNGHTFKSSILNIYKSKSCPMCRYFFNEEVCRFYFQYFTGHLFPKVRPKWMISTNGQRLELDGYSEPLKLAFEYRGEQHYEYILAFHKTIEEFEENKRRWKLKPGICKESDVTLIEIPYTVENLGQYIRDKLIELNVPILRTDIPPCNIQSDKNDKHEGLKSRLEELQEHATKKGGKLISAEYRNLKHKLEWECDKKHRWLAQPDNILHGNRWCPECAPNKKLTLEKVLESIKDKQIICLSKEYVNNRIKMDWNCKSCDYKWQATYDNVGNGSGCPKCAGHIKLTIEEIRNFISESPIELLSTEYVNNSTKMDWKCKKCSYVWKTAFSVIQQGSGCPKCAGIIRLTINDVKSVIRNRPIELLSTEYINNSTKMLWKCKICQNEWYGKYYNIQSGKGCPKWQSHTKISNTRNSSPGKLTKTQ